MSDKYKKILLFVCWEQLKLDFTIAGRSVGKTATNIQDGELCRKS